MKKLLLPAIAALLCTISCFGALDYQTSGIGIEIQNKARRPLWVAVLNGDKLFQPAHVQEIEVKGLKKLIPTIHSTSAKIDINKPTKIAIWYQNPGKVEYKTKIGGLIGKEGFVPTPHKVYSFSPGKTLYLTWDASDFPRPQTGKMGGLAGVTESGLGLNLNVGPTDIKEELVTA